MPPKLPATVMAFETALAKASVDNVARRDPQTLDHKTSFTQLQAMTLHFDWAAYFDAAKLPRVDLNVQEPAFMAEFDRQIASTPLPEWKTYLTWQFLHGSAPYLSEAFVDENFGFYQNPASQEWSKVKAALEAVRGVGRSVPGRSRGSGVCGSLLPSGG